MKTKRTHSLNNSDYTRNRNETARVSLHQAVDHRYMAGLKRITGDLGHFSLLLKNIQKKKGMNLVNNRIFICRVTELFGEKFWIDRKPQSLIVLRIALCINEKD
jgi:hypothetical protein